MCTSPSKVLLYVQNLVLIFLTLVTSCFGLLILWISSLSKVAVILFELKRSARYSLLMGVVMILLVFNKCIFATVTLVSRLGINLVTSPNDW